MALTERYLLDTNILGYIASGRSRAARNTLEQTRASAPVCLSVMTEAEMLFGLERRPEATRLRTSITALMRSFHIPPWNSEAAQTYAKLRFNPSATGRTLAVMDLLIAAHALAIGATLVSHDKALHQLAPHLHVVDWATDL